MKISVVIPTHDRPEYLMETLKAVLNQTRKADEILIINNGERKVEVASGMNEVKVIDIKPHAGAAKARNHGAQEATGDFIAFLDDDDLWEAKYLENIANEIENGSRCIISRLDKLENELISEYKNAHGKIKAENILVYNPGITGSNIVIDRELFLEVGGFDYKLPPSEDKSLVLELIKRKIPVATLPANQAIIREHDSERLTDSAKMARGIYEFTKKYKSMMGLKQKVANRLKIYRYRYEAGNKLSFLPFVLFYLLNKFLKNDFMIRPSKTYLFGRLRKELGKVKGGVGIDAASAHFKNRRMFKTDFYYGLDYDLDALKDGVAKNMDNNTFGIHADLKLLGNLPSNSAKVVVSTNTIDHLDKSDRVVALEHLTRLTSKSGELICHTSINESFDELVKSLNRNFENVKVIYFKNLLSQIYEKIFERQGDLGSHPIAGSKPFRLLAWVISRVEYLTGFIKLGNQQALIICKNKKDTLEAKKFDLTGVPLIEKRIYSIL